MEQQQWKWRVVFLFSFHPPVEVIRIWLVWQWPVGCTSLAWMVPWLDQFCCAAVWLAGGSSAAYLTTTCLSGTWGGSSSGWCCSFKLQSFHCSHAQTHYCRTTQGSLFLLLFLMNNRTFSMLPVNVDRLMETCKWFEMSLVNCTYHGAINHLHLCVTRRIHISLFQSNTFSSRCTSAQTSSTDFTYPYFSWFFGPCPGTTPGYHDR